MRASISRRTILCGLAAGAAARAVAASPAEIYLSPGGSDTNAGTKARPLKTIGAAQQAVRKLKARGPVTVWFRAGTYYLPKTVVFTEEDSGTSEAPVTYSAFPEEEAVISGGARLALSWKPYTRWHHAGARRLPGSRPINSSSMASGSTWRATPTTIPPPATSTAGRQTRSPKSVRLGGTTRAAVSFMPCTVASGAPALCHHREGRGRECDV